MALKLMLKPQERLIIGGAVITNGPSPVRITVENNVPVLRGKEIMAETEATSPCRRIYFSIQLMYVDEKNIVEHHKIFWELARDLIEAAPSTAEQIRGISELILAGKYYQALKETRKLIDYEEELIRHATECH